MTSNLCPEAQTPYGRHNWRHLEQHARYENFDTDREAVVTVDYWYCTSCRVIESSERERPPVGLDD